MLSTNDIPLAESALLVVDAQDSFKVDPKWERRNNRDFERNVGALIDAYRAASLPVIFFLHTDDDPGFERGSVHVRLMDFITVREGEPVIHKDTRNTFTGTTLQAQLLALGVRRLAITGIQMEQCCETTARVAADLGYAVDFVIDGTMTFPIRNWDVPGEELGVEAIEERTIFALRRRFARIVRTETLIGELAETMVVEAV
ncbi:MAG TPA: isochorismatase family protein [Gemmatimonadaceae bacterium]|nr:isochorismatase family protein [Gemmatimonadaceae bacterium]